MQLKVYIAAVLLAAFGLTSHAQTSSKARARHQAAQKELLANQNQNRIDNNTIKSFITRDVDARENALAGLSKESVSMLDDILREGHKHIGKRYVWGSKGPNTFDCSGFTSYVYRQFGITLAPQSRLQYQQGTAVNKNQLRKGDLVFFSSPRTAKGVVGHVGIVWSADNEKGTFKFIHASVRGVKISDFEGYYVSRYIGARRIINK